MAAVISASGKLRVEVVEVVEVVDVGNCGFDIIGGEREEEDTITGSVDGAVPTGRM